MTDGAGWLDGSDGFGRFRTVSDGLVRTVSDGSDGSDHGTVRPRLAYTV